MAMHPKLTAAIDHKAFVVQIASGQYGSYIDVSLAKLRSAFPHNSIYRWRMFESGYWEVIPAELSDSRTGTDMLREDVDLHADRRWL